MLAEKANRIKVLFTDVDGVLTDGGIYYDSNGSELKKFYVKDGQICKILKRNGIQLGIITGRSSFAVQRRSEELNFDYVYQNVDNKLELISNLIEELGFDSEELAYIGDDINDYELLKFVGLSACPNDAVEIIRENVDYVCEKNGGQGTYREFSDLILKFRDDTK